MNVALLGFLLVALLGSLRFFRSFRHQRRARRLGQEGERIVSQQLRKAIRHREAILLDDLLLPYRGKWSQTDHIVLTPYGLLVVETKNYGGYVRGSWVQSTWLHRVGTQSFSPYSPLWQNDTHMKAIFALLADGLPKKKKASFVRRSQNLVVLTSRCKLTMDDGFEGTSPAGFSAYVMQEDALASHVARFFSQQKRTTKDRLSVSEWKTLAKILRQASPRGHARKKAMRQHLRRRRGQIAHHEPLGVEQHAHRRIGDSSLAPYFFQYDGGHHPTET